MRLLPERGGGGEEVGGLRGSLLGNYRGIMRAPSSLPPPPGLLQELFFFFCEWGGVRPGCWYLPARQQLHHHHLPAGYHGDFVHQGHRETFHKGQRCLWGQEERLRV